VVLDAEPEGVGAAGRVAPDLDVGDTSVPDAPGAAAAIVLSLVMVTAIPDWLVHAAVSTVSAAHTAVTVRRERLTPNPRRILHRLSAGAFRLRCCSRVLLPSGRCRPSQMLGVDRFKWRSAPGGQRLLPGAASVLRPVDQLLATVVSSLATVVQRNRAGQRCSGFKAGSRVARLGPRRSGRHARRGGRSDPAIVRP